MADSLKDKLASIKETKVEGGLLNKLDKVRSTNPSSLKDKIKLVRTGGFFDPVADKVRIRDVVRELPGAAGKVGQAIAGFAVDIPRAVVRYGARLRNDPEATITPTTRAQKFFAGDEPFGGFAQATRTGQTFSTLLREKITGEKPQSPLVQKDNKNILDVIAESNPTTNEATLTGVLGLGVLDVWFGGSEKKLAEESLEKISKELVEQTTERGVKQILEREAKELSEQSIDKVALAISRESDSNAIRSILKREYDDVLRRNTELVESRFVQAVDKVTGEKEVFRIKPEQYNAINKAIDGADGGASRSIGSKEYHITAKPLSSFEEQGFKFKGAIDIEDLKFTSADVSQKAGRLGADAQTKLTGKVLEETTPLGGRLPDDVVADTSKFADNILPPNESIAAEAKLVGAKRIAPDRIPHQQLTPGAGIEAVLESKAKGASRRAEGYASALKKLTEIKAKYGSKLPARTKTNLAKYPDLADDFRLWQQFKRYSSNGTMDDAIARFERFSQTKISPDRREQAIKDYIALVKKDISKGYKFPDAVLDFDPSFRKALTSRERYEKGLATSFSADDTRIVFDEKGRISAGMKRQDGKEILPEQKDEIIEGVLQTQKALGLDLNELARDERWVYVHLNGKNPFLRKNTAGLYRKDIKNKSVSISLGGVENYEIIVDGKRVSKRINTTISHEIGHALDYQTQNTLIDYTTVRDLAGKYKRVENSFRGDKYWRSSEEVKARMIEQYVAIKEGNTSYFNKPGYWSKEIFDEKIKPAVEEAVDRHFSQYKKSASELPSFDAPKKVEAPAPKAKEAESSNALIKEAQKYKSAEEFVKANNKDNFPDFVAGKLGGKVAQREGAIKGMEEVVGGGAVVQFGDNRLGIRIGEFESKIDISGVQLEKTGTGLGSKVMNELRNYADIKDKEINIFKVTNPKFFDQFEWLAKKGDDYFYEPSGITNRLDFTRDTKSQLTDIWNKANSQAKKTTTKKVVSKVDLTSPKEVAEEAVKVQRRVSGTEPDGVRTAAKKLDGLKQIPKTPAKSSRYALDSNPPIEIPDEKRMAFLQRKLQDKFNRLTFIQGKIAEKKGLPISDDLNAYLQQEMFHGRAADRLDKFEKAVISTKGQSGEALLERMAKDDITLDEMGEFLHAKHAPARNKRVAEINPDIPDGGSGLTNKEAEKIIAKYRKAGKAEKMESYANEVYEKIVKARLKILEDEHLLKPEAIDKIARSFEDGTYIPLKLAEKPDVRLRGGKGFDVRGKDIKRLKGSTNSKRNNPLVQAILDYEDTVIKAEKNKVGRTLKKLIEENPNVVNHQGQKLWTVEAQKYAPVYNKFGEVEYIKPAGYKLADNVMEVRDRGKIYHITINDQALASAMKNLGTERGVKFFHQINNYLRSVIIFYNPEFWITNFERDLQTALINTAGEQGAKDAGNVAKNVPAALKGIWRESRGKASKPVKSGATDWAKEYAELKEVGGKVGWFDSKTVVEKQAQIQRRINKAAGKKPLDKAARIWDAVAEYVSDVNESVESGVRLSAYVNAKKAGMSKEQAASLAKNLTVNFNKKGEWGSAINSLYLFANAGIQGTARVFRSLKHKRTRRIVGGIAAFAFGVEFMNRQVNEEAYKKISDYEKNTNLIFMLPDGADGLDLDPAIGSVEQVPGGNEKYIKIKLPYGYNIFKVLGDVAYDMSLGEKGIGESLKRLVFAMDESFNPLSSGSAAQLVSPTITDPAVQIYENKNYFGAPIKPEQSPYGAKKKDSDRYFSSVREATRKFTDWLNDVSGGNEVEAGLLDLSPEDVDHIIDFLGGGISKFFANVVDTGLSLADGDLPPVDNTPFVRKFIGDVYDEAERSIFYKLLDKGETKLLTPREKEEFKKYAREALQEGQIDSDQLGKSIDTLSRNQNKIHAGRIFDEMQSREDEKAQVFREYIQENGLEGKEEAIFEQLQDISKEYKLKNETSGSGKGFVKTLVDGGRGLFIDPQNVLKAIFTEEKLGEVTGNLVELQRFYGLEFNEAGGSQERKAELMRQAGIEPTDEAMKAYKLEHILPVKAGGDTSDDNLKIVSNNEHNLYTPLDIAVIEAVKAGYMTRKEAEELMIQLKVDKSITPEQLYKEVKSRVEKDL